MLIDDNAMKADGLTDAEIREIAARLHHVLEVGQVDCRPALLFSVERGSEPQLVSVEYAIALERLRPPCWHVILADGLHPYWARKQQVKRRSPERQVHKSIDDLFDVERLRRHPPSTRWCWVCAKPWEKYRAPIASPNNGASGFPEYPVIVVPIKKHMQRVAPGVDNVPDEIAVCFDCFNEYAEIYHQVLADLIAEG